MYRPVVVPLRAPYSGFGAEILLACPPGQVRDASGTCKLAQGDDPTCPDGQALNFNTNKCEPSCPEGQTLNLKTLKCESPGMSTNTKLLIGGALVLGAMLILK